MALTHPLRGLLSGASRLPRLLAPAFNGREGMLTAGLATLASDRPGLAALAEGMLVGRQAGQQAQDAERFQQAMQSLPLSAQQRAMLSALPQEVQQKVLAQILTSGGADPKVVGRALIDPSTGKIIYRDPAELSGDALFAYRSLGIDPYTATPEEQERVRAFVKELRESSRTSVTVDARPPVEQGMDEVGLKLYDNAVQEFNDARAQISNLQSLKALGDTYGWNNMTGWWQNATLGIRQASASLFGLPLGDNVGAQEAFRSISNRMALAARSEGMTGPMSDRDVIFLENMVPRLANTPTGNKIIIEVMMRMAQRKQERALAMDRFLRSRGGRSTEGMLEYMAEWDRRNAIDLSDLRKQGNALLGVGEGR